MNHPKARVGIRVHCDLDGRITYRMFYCRGRRGPTWHWAREMIALLSSRSVGSGVFGEFKIKAGETRRYWAQVKLVGTRDYWGEYDDDLEIISYRRAK